MDHLEGAGRIQGCAFGRAKLGGIQQSQHRPEAFSRGQQGIAHGLDKAIRGRADPWRQFGQTSIDSGPQGLKSLNIGGVVVHT